MENVFKNCSKSRVIRTRKKEKLRRNEIRSDKRKRRNEIISSIEIERLA